MSVINLNNIKVGILGGGQLGKMLCQAASTWHLNTYILDPESRCPSSNLCTHFVEGDFKDFDNVVEFGKKVDILTIEIENVNVDALTKLESEGKKVRPATSIISIIKNKSYQKEFFVKNNLPTSKFKIFKDTESLVKSYEEGGVQIPFVQKLSESGYDGRGVAIVEGEKSLKTLLKGHCIVEELVNVKKELSVIVCRNILDEIECYAPVEMVFSSSANLVEYLFSPADISNKISKDAMELAVETIKAFNLYGILAVEMFLDENEKLLINEVAPRPHNSGHHTIESCATSQYEQHLRTLLDLPLGRTDIKIPSVMVNILGEPGYEGIAKYEGLNDCLNIEGVKIHIYGKKTTKPFRKMGHATIVNEDISKALEKANFIKKKLKVVS